MPKQNRKAIFEAVNLAGRELSASSVIFHSLMAEKFGLSVTDWRAWDMVMRHGPLTAGDFAKLTGLTRGAVTGLIDRLVGAGVVERVADSRDRRKVLVKSVTQPSQQQDRESLFSPMLKALERLYADYSDDELQTIAGFMTRMSVLLREQTAKLNRNQNR